MKRMLAAFLCVALLAFPGCSGLSGRVARGEPTQPPAPEILPLIDLEALTYGLLGRWKTVSTRRGGETLDAMQMEEYGLEENLIFTMEPSGDGEIYMQANFLRCNGGDLWDEYFRVESRIVPITAWRPETSQLQTSNTQWSVHLVNPLDGSGNRELYLSLEDATHLTLVEVYSHPGEEAVVIICYLEPMGLEETGIIFPGEQAASYVVEDTLGSWECVSGLVDGSTWVREEYAGSSVELYYEGDRLLMNLYREMEDYYGIPLVYREEPGGELYRWCLEAGDDWGGGTQLTVYLADENTLVLKHFFYYDETIPVNSYEFLWRHGFAYDETAAQREINDRIDRCPEEAKVILWEEPWYRHPLHYAWSYNGQVPMVIACAAPSASIALCEGSPVYDSEGRIVDWENSYEVVPRQAMPRGDYLYVGVTYPWNRDATPTQYLSIIIDGEECFWPVVDLDLQPGDWVWID